MSKLACNEFCGAAKSMAKGKAPSLDGVVVEFYFFFGELISTTPLV
jgi:hypothetical protein